MERTKKLSAKDIGKHYFCLETDELLEFVGIGTFKVSTDSIAIAMLQALANNAKKAAH